MTEPLTAQLSRMLVACTIEADDALEHRIPHRTTDHGTTGGPAPTPWLVSLLMWSMCLRFVPPDGTDVRSFTRSAWWLIRKGVGTTLWRMGGWWGYLTVDGARAAPAAERALRLTEGGRRAREAWEPLTEEIERRWDDRFGADRVAALRSALGELVDRFDEPLPDCLPLFDVDLVRRAPAHPEPAGTLPGLLSQALLRFDVEFDATHPVPLVVTANVLHALDSDGVRVKDLPVRTGLAKEGVASGLKALERRRLVEVGTGPAGGRLRVATLTRVGVARRKEGDDLVLTLERRWRDRYGAACLGALADAAVTIAGDPGSLGDPEGPLWSGLHRYPEGWRAALPRPLTLPRHPVPSHRGGYLDGS